MKQALPDLKKTTEPEKTVPARSYDLATTDILRLALDAVGVGVVITDVSREGHPVIYHNKEFEKMTGYTEAEVTGKNCRFLQGKETNPQTVDHLRKAISEGSSFRGPILNYRKDGSTFWNLLTITPVLDTDKKLTHFIGIQSDITQQVKNEYALKEQSEKLQHFNEKFTLAQHAAGVGIWDWNIKDNRLTWDDQMFRLYDIEPGRFTGKYEDWKKIVFPGDIKRVEDLLQQAIAGDGEFSAQFKIILSTGKPRYIQSMGRVSYDESGQPIRMLGTNWDVSKLTTALEELEISQKQYHDLYHDTPAMMYSTDHEGRIVNVSKYWLKKMAFRKDAVLGKKFTEFLTLESRKYALGQVLPQFRKAGYAYNVPYQFVTKKGEVIETLLSTISEKDENGAIVKSLAVITDVTKEKQAERKLLESQQKFKRIFDNVKDLVCLHTPAGTYLEVSPSIMAIAGYETHELIGKNPYHFFHPEDRERIKRESHQRFLEEKGSVPEIRYRFKHKNGHYLWFQTQTQAVTNKKGEVVQLITSSRDLTEVIESGDKLQKLLKDLARSEWQLKCFIQQAPVAVAMLDRHMRYISASEMWCKTYGIKEKTIVGKSHYDVLTGILIAPRWLDEHERVLKGERLHREKHKLLRKDGSVQYLTYTLLPWYEEADQVGGMIVYTADITSQVVYRDKIENLNHELEKQVSERTAQLKASHDRLSQLSDELLSQKNLLEAVINNTSSLIFLKDLDGKYIMVNDRYKKVFKLKEISGKTDYDIFPHEVADQLSRTDKEVAQKMKLLETVETVPQDGEMHTYLSVKFPLFDNRGDIFSVCGIATDITHEKDQQERLKEQADELKQFAYLASHDLQEPLRIITSYMQLLEEEYPNDLGEDGKKYIDRSVKAARRMKALINDLLSYSRITTKESVFKSIDLNKVLEGVLENLEITIKETHAVVRYESLPKVTADPIQLGQLFQNLIGNALKYKSPNHAPFINISVTIDIGVYQFCVSDNGIGIAPRFKERVFEIFQRLHSKKQYSGTGIGLAICRRIVDRHGGKIWVESTPGEGSSFFFTLKK